MSMSLTVLEYRAWTLAILSRVFGSLKSVKECSDVDFPLSIGSVLLLLALWFLTTMV
jgi:hypothetical protein